MSKVSRRNFLGGIVGCIFGASFLPKTGFSKENLERTDIDGSKQLELLKSITWDYLTDDVDPITYINGQPVKQYMWKAVSGEYVPNGKIHKITDRKIMPEKLASTFVPIHPMCITRCNVNAGWIEYARILRWNTISGVVKQTQNLKKTFNPVESIMSGQRPYSFSYPSFLSDTKGRVILYVGTNLRGLTVTLLDPKGEVITTLRGK